MKERIAITYAYDGKFWDHQRIVFRTEGPDAESSKCRAECERRAPKQDDPEVWKRDWKRLLREHPFTVYTEHEVKCEGRGGWAGPRYLPKLGSVMAAPSKRGNVCKAFANAK